MPDLIFVTDITDYIRGEKSVMWRNFLSHTSFFRGKSNVTLVIANNGIFKVRLTPPPAPFVIFSLVSV